MQPAKTCGFVGQAGLQSTTCMNCRDCITFKQPLLLSPATSPPWVVQCTLSTQDHTALHMYHTYSFSPICPALPNTTLLLPVLVLPNNILPAPSHWFQSQKGTRSQRATPTHNMQFCRNSPTGIAPHARICQQQPMPCCQQHCRCCYSYLPATDKCSTAINRAPAPHVQQPPQAHEYTLPRAPPTGRKSRTLLSTAALTPAA
jgi:hypothetical protein